MNKYELMAELESTLKNLDLKYSVGKKEEGEASFFSVSYIMSGEGESKEKIDIILTISDDGEDLVILSYKEIPDVEKYSIGDLALFLLDYNENGVFYGTLGLDNSKERFSYNNFVKINNKSITSDLVEDYLKYALLIMLSVQDDFTTFDWNVFAK